MADKNFVIPLLLGAILLGGVIPSSFSTESYMSVNPDIEQSGIFYGYQVVEVKISNPEFSDTTEAEGEQDVTVNGRILRMVQATDGNWYGYFAQIDQAQIADSTTDVDGEGTDFGTFCGSGSTILGIDVFDSVGIAVNSQDGIDGTNPSTKPIPNCNVSITPDNSINVLDNVQPINMDSPIGPGQHFNMDPEAWPFIQLYPITEELGVTIQYNVFGDAEFIILDYLEQFPSPDTLIQSIISQVQEMELASNTEAKLLNHLNKIANNLEDGNSNNNKNICNLLNSFENKVNSMTGKQISFDEAQNLIESVESAKEIICN